MYIEKGPLISPLVAASVATESLASIAVKGRYVCVQQCVLKGVRLIITTATSGAVGTAAVKVRIAHGSGTGELTVGSVSIQNAAATTGGVQTTLYKDFAGVVVPVGAELCFDQSVATGAGSALIEYIVEEDPETAANIPSMLAMA